MTKPCAHPDDPHRINRSGWLRAAVLGANDGIVSVSSLLIGVATAGPSHETILLAGTAALTAGAMSMAAGEFVSVSSQADIERADIAREKQALAHAPETELTELAEIYQLRGVSEETSYQVAKELHEHDALDAHMRDEIGLTDALSANPLQAALTSGLTFSLAGAIPLIAAWQAPEGGVIPAVLIVTLLALGLLGATGARIGGAPMLRAIGRVMIWGVLAMALTAFVGRLFGVSV
ncbi:VIT family protein [Paracoccaceae bacterium GXU_MW_L88]